MALQLQRLVRPNILSLKPYRSARDKYSQELQPDRKIVGRFLCNYLEGILLDANECVYGSSIPIEGDHHRYPCPYQRELKQKIAEFRNVKREQVFLGVGSDEAIDMIMRVFCVPAHDSILVTPPTYDMYEVLADTNDVNVIKVPLTKDFQLQVDKILDALTPETKVIYLCSPNNPTANNMATEDILDILNSSYEGIVAVDEAYVDFSATPSLSRFVKDHPRLIVLQTMSKAFGLAGIRLGWAIAHKDIVAIFNKVKLPYNINKLSSKVACQAFSGVETMHQNVRKILEEKEKFIAELEKLPFVKKIFPSDASFLLVKTEHAYELYETMADRGVVTRYRGDALNCDDCLRITVGTPEQNVMLLEMMKKTVAEIESTKCVQNGYH